MVVRGEALRNAAALESVVIAHVYCHGLFIYALCAAFELLPSPPPGQTGSSGQLPDMKDQMLYMLLCALSLGEWYVNY